jgi:hypothetical protein
MFTFIRRDGDSLGMSQATKVVVGTIAVSVVLSFALIAYYAFLV